MHGPEGEELLQRMDQVALGRPGPVIPSRRRHPVLASYPSAPSPPGIDDYAVCAGRGVAIVVPHLNRISGPGMHWARPLDHERRLNDPSTLADELNRLRPRLPLGIPVEATR